MPAEGRLWPSDDDGDGDGDEDGEGDGNGDDDGDDDDRKEMMAQWQPPAPLLQYIWILCLFFCPINCQMRTWGFLLSFLSDFPLFVL